MSLKTIIHLSKVSIHITIINQLTGEEVINNFPGVEIHEYSTHNMINNANAFADMMPDCCVRISASNGDFICIPSRNMMRDEETMSYVEYVAKWYGDIIQLEREEQ